MIHHIHARFRLDRVTRMCGYYKAPGDQEAKIVEGAYVELGAVQGEPFGSATPSGDLKMGIVNPPAAQVFFAAPIGQEFDVVVSPVEKAETPV
jgi:hypothetical protein